MVKLRLLVLCTAVVGCDSSEYNRPIELTRHGVAVRSNMAAHIINPIPGPRRDLVTDANRPVQATRNYRTNEVEAAAPEEGQTLTGAVE